MSIFDGIKKKIIQRNDVNPMHEDLKFAVSNKPRENLDRYDPFGRDEQKGAPEMFQRGRTEVDNFKPPRFEPMDMPLERAHNQFAPGSDKSSLEYIINQLDAVRAQNEMILKRLQNIERILNER